MIKKGLSSEQSHRILESLQRKSLISKVVDMRAKEHKDDMLHTLVQLSLEEDNAIYADIKGMLYGNNNRRRKNVE